jgi:hypothetical protein
MLFKKPTTFCQEHFPTKRRTAPAAQLVNAFGHYLQTEGGRLYSAVPATAERPPMLE